MSDVLSRVVRALGRSEPSRAAPTPPDDESVIRLLPTDADLVETFIKMATAAQLKVERASEQDIAEKIAAFVKNSGCRRVGVSVSQLAKRLNIAPALKAAGLDVRGWDEMTLDESYELDCGVTDIYAAVAETGSLVIFPDAECGRALSLVPLTHVAIVEAKTIVGDLLDLFAKVSREGKFPNFTFITGPSKTGDIEGVLVTGVHGPGVVQIFLMP